MTEPITSARSDQLPLAFDTPIGCPLCRAALTTDGERIFCPPCDRTDCPRGFHMINGFPDLVVGERFEDTSDDELIRNEERNTAHTVRHYWEPLFRRLTGGHGARPTVLALGCGAGLEVDLLRDEGFECVGIDNGNRARAWANRQSAHALAMANAMHVPFPDAFFDLAFCGCVFPHVGVVGDSFRVTGRYWTDRLVVAREMARVVKPGGQIVVSSPNRWFPLDLFHGRPIGSYRTPINPPWRRFLLGLDDYRRLFTAAGCAGPATAESIRNYWGFCRMGQTVRGRLLSMPVRALLFLGSTRAMRYLWTSSLLPWIVIRIQR